MSSHRKAIGKVSRTASILISSGDFLGIRLLPCYSIKRITVTPTFANQLSLLMDKSSGGRLEITVSAASSDTCRTNVLPHKITTVRASCDASIPIPSGGFRLAGKEAVLSPERGEKLTGKHNTPNKEKEKHIKGNKSP